MRLWQLVPIILSCSLMLLCPAKASEFQSSSNTAATSVQREFAANGIVEEVRPGAGSIVIRHQAISNYMAAMTMPFKVKSHADLAGVRAGDEISFKLHVTDNESWIDRITKIGTVPLAKNTRLADAPPVQSPVAPENNPLLDYKFTNELGRAVSLNDYRGQALAVTFFYTRCPLPEFCPRLSKNFQEASEQLEAMTNAPANWHFLSISFDTEFDSPAMLKAYGESYQYDPARWSFLTGPPDKIADLARESGVTYQSDNGTINHNFRTLIIDATGHLQMIFPTGGNLSGQIAAEIIKAAAVTNQAIAQNQSR
jgi:protein SCO1/2